MRRRFQWSLAPAVLLLLLIAGCCPRPAESAAGLAAAAAEWVEVLGVSDGCPQGAALVAALEEDFQLHFSEGGGGKQFYVTPPEDQAALALRALALAMTSDTQIMIALGPDHQLLMVGPRSITYRNLTDDADDGRVYNRDAPVLRSLPDWRGPLLYQEQ